MAISTLACGCGGAATWCDTRQPSTDSAQEGDGSVATDNQSAREAGVLAAYSAIGRQGGEVRLWRVCTEHEGPSLLRVSGAPDREPGQRTAAAAARVEVEGTAIPPAITMSVVDGTGGSGRHAAARSSLPSLA